MSISLSFFFLISQILLSQLPPSQSCKPEVLKKTSSVHFCDYISLNATAFMNVQMMTVNDDTLSIIENNVLYELPIKKAFDAKTPEVNFVVPPTLKSRISGSSSWYPQMKWNCIPDKPESDVSDSVRIVNSIQLRNKRFYHILTYFSWYIYDFDKGTYNFDEDLDADHFRVIEQHKSYDRKYYFRYLGERVIVERMDITDTTFEFPQRCAADYAPIRRVEDSENGPQVYTLTTNDERNMLRIERFDDEDDNDEDLFFRLPFGFEIGGRTFFLTNTRSHRWLTRVYYIDGSLTKLISDFEGQSNNQSIEVEMSSMDWTEFFRCSPDAVRAKVDELPQDEYYEQYFPKKPIFSNWTNTRWKVITCAVFGLIIIVYFHTKYLAIHKLDEKIKK